MTEMTLSYESREDICAAIEKIATSTHLICAHTVFDDVCMRTLATALANNTHIMSIELLFTRIYKDGACALATALETNRCITKIDISFNCIRDEGACALANALAKNTHLTTIDISHNSIGDTGIRAIANVLETNTSVTHINLSRNDIAYKGVYAIARMIEVNTSLVSIGLYTNFMINGASAVIDACWKNTTIRKFWVCDTSSSLCIIGNRNFGIFLSKLLRICHSSLLQHLAVEQHVGIIDMLCRSWPWYYLSHRKNRIDAYINAVKHRHV